jgi:protein gp37
VTHAIEWCTHTENPITGCRHGCPWCYARRFAHRHAANPTIPHYRAVTDALGNPFAPALHLDVLKAMRDRMQRARQRRRVFLGSMSDVACAGDWGIFARGALVDTWPNGMVQNLIAGVCGALRHHHFLLLTKDPIGLLDLWPPNVWLGTSCTDSRTARDNVSALLVSGLHQTEPQIRWASVEPLQDPDFDPIHLDGLDWVVVGTQTGPGAPVAGRNSAPGLVRAAARIVVWGADHGVPVFVKRNLRLLGSPPVDTGAPTLWPQQIPVPNAIPGGVTPCP